MADLKERWYFQQLFYADRTKLGQSGKLHNMYWLPITSRRLWGSSSGQAIEAMSLIKNQLGVSLMNGLSAAYQETQAGNTTNYFDLMALLVASACTGVQYESWISPVAAVMGLRCYFGSDVGAAG